MKKQTMPKIRARPSFKTFEISKRGEKGYRAYTIRKGKEKIISSILPRGQALKFGAEYSMRTLGATFGIKPVKKKVYAKDISYQPSTKVFRSYKIRGKARIPLKDVFIQRTRKEGGLMGGRLSFGSEVGAIQSAKRMNIGRII